MPYQYLDASRSSFVHRLPPELPVEIFQAFAPPRYPRWPHATSMDDPRRVSHVCSNWRSISLGPKKLWTSIPIKNEFWAALSLERSRSLPVSVSITLDEFYLDAKGRKKVPTYELHDGMQRALSEPHRLCALYIELHTSMFGTTRPQWLGHKLFVFLEDAEVPLLEFLSVDMHFYDYVAEYNSFLGHPPPSSLHHLSSNGLYQGNLPSSHLLSTPLTTLELGSGVIWVSLEDAFSSLSSLPSPEKLVIRRDRDDMFLPGAIPATHILDIGIEPRSIALPHLKELRLYESLELISCLMRSLAFPISATVDLHDANDGADEELGAPARVCLDILFAELNAHFAQFVAEERFFQSLFLQPEAEVTSQPVMHRVQLVADCPIRDREIPEARSYLMTDRVEARDVSTFPEPPRNRPLSLSLCSDESISVQELIVAVTSVPVLREAQALVVNERYPSGAQNPFFATSPLEWVDVTQSFGNIRVACLCSYVAIRHMETFLAAKDASIVPNLVPTELVIEDVSFLSPISEQREAHMSLDRFILALHQCVSANTQKPHADRLHHVELVFCDIDEDQMTRLRREFGNGSIKWDGQTRGSSTSRRRELWYGFTSDTE